MKKTFDLHDFEIRITSSDLPDDIKKKDIRWSCEIFPGNTGRVRRKTEKERFLMAYEFNGIEYPSVTTITGILDKASTFDWAVIALLITSKKILDAIKDPHTEGRGSTLEQARKAACSKATMQAGTKTQSY